MKVVIGLGANLGDRLANLKEAVERIGAIAPVLSRSRVYETAALTLFGSPPQPDYLNAAALIEWNSDLHALLKETQRIENELGRVRTDRWGPRTIDLDILWADGVTVAERDLVVPHPELLRRPFALLPLLDVMPAPGVRLTAERL